MNTKFEEILEIDKTNVRLAQLEITRYLYQLHQEKDFLAVDDFIRNVNPDDMSVGLIVSTLSSTYPMKKYLRFRNKFLLASQKSVYLRGLDENGLWIGLE